MIIEQYSHLSVYETFNHISSSKEATIYWGKYGRLALSFLKERSPDFYVKLVMTNQLTQWVHETNDWLTAHRLCLLNRALYANPLDKEASINDIAAHHIAISTNLDETIQADLRKRINATSSINYHS